jgi:hypothetical protein
MPPKTQRLNVFEPYQPTQTLPRARERARRPPFFLDPSHTIPTKWSLYRPLLRALRGPAALRTAVPSAAIAVASQFVPREVKRDASFDAILALAPAHPPQPLPPTTPAAAHPFLLDAVRARWRKARITTSVPQARDFILRAENVLAAIRHGEGEAAALEAEARGFAIKAGARAAADAEAAAERERERRRKPFLTGGFMRANMFNLPMPRIKPQPVRLGCMIRARALRRVRRINKDRRADEEMDDMRREIAFWRELGVGEPEDLGERAPTASQPLGSAPGSWEVEYHRYKALLSEQFSREDVRALTPFSAETLAAVKEARRRRHRYCVNRAREAHGLGPLFDDEGNKIPGAEEEGSVKALNRERWEAARARREVARGARR